MTLTLGQIDARLENIEKKRRISQLSPSVCRELRRSKGLKQHDLARILCVTPGLISKLENGRIQSYQTAEAILMLADVPLDEHGIDETPGLRARVDEMRSAW